MTEKLAKNERDVWYCALLFAFLTELVTLVTVVADFRSFLSLPRLFALFLPMMLLAPILGARQARATLFKGVAATQRSESDFTLARMISGCAIAAYGLYIVTFTALRVK
jgi:hypothetical protein